MDRENKLLIVIVIVAFIISLGGIIAYESSVDDSLMNIISQATAPESYQTVQGLEFKVPKGYNLTLNGTDNLVMTTKDASYSSTAYEDGGFYLPKDKGISAISITYISGNNSDILSNSSDNNNNNNTIDNNYSNNNYSNNTYSNNNYSNNSYSNSSYFNSNNFTNASSNINNSNDINNNNETNESNNETLENIDISKISVSNPSNNFTVDGVTIFPIDKVGINSYIFAYKNGLYAISFYSANSTNSSVADEMFKSVTDKTFK